MLKYLTTTKSHYTRFCTLHVTVVFYNRGPTVCPHALNRTPNPCGYLMSRQAMCLFPNPHVDCVKRFVNNLNSFLIEPWYELFLRNSLAAPMSVSCHSNKDSLSFTPSISAKVNVSQVAAVLACCSLEHHGFELKLRLNYAPERGNTSVLHSMPVVEPQGNCVLFFLAMKKFISLKHGRVSESWKW